MGPEQPEPAQARPVTLLAGLDREQWAAARLWASTRQPYLATALFSIEVIPEPGIGTVGIDEGWTLHADPELVADWEADELGRVILHLASHLVRDHAKRAEEIPDDHLPLWALAADAEVNDDLAADHLIPGQAPDEPADFECPAHGMAESYLDELLNYQTPPQRRGTLDCGSGSDGRNRPWDDPPNMDQDRQRLTRAQVATSVREEMGRDPGSVPEGWARWAEHFLRPTVDWRRALAAELRQCIASVAGLVDYTYSRPSRRASAVADVILPALHHPMPEIAVVCDTSSSITDGLLGRTLAEVDGILQAVGQRGDVRVLAVDTVVHAVTRVRKAADVVVRGGGGTNMGAGINAALKLHPRPDIVIVLTDGYTPWPEHPPRAKVVIGLLVVKSDRSSTRVETPRWARTVVIEDRKK